MLVSLAPLALLMAPDPAALRVAGTADGEWTCPRPEWADVDDHAHAAQVLPSAELTSVDDPEAHAPHRLYLRFSEGAAEDTLQSCGEDATRNCSTLCQGCCGSPWPRWAGWDIDPDKYISEIVTCMQHYWYDFNVEITLERPETGPYTMAMIGPGDSGEACGYQGIFGYAPMDSGNYNPNNVCIALICGSYGCYITLSQELAHTYGVQHTSDPCDVMYNTSSNCTEPEGRRFKGYSYDLMKQVIGAWPGGIKPDPLAPLGLGPSGPCYVESEWQPDMGPPEVAITYPNDGDTFEAGADFEIVAEASDDVGVKRVDLYSDGTLAYSDTEAPFSWPVTGIPEGSYTFHVIAVDASGNETQSESVGIGVGGAEPPPGSSSSGGPGTDEDGDDGDGGGDGGGPNGDDGNWPGDPSSPGGGDETGCGCSHHGSGWVGGVLLVLVAAIGGRSRRS